MAVADVKIDNLIESIFCHYRKLNPVCLCFTFVYESVPVITVVL